MSFMIYINTVKDNVCEGSAEAGIVQKTSWKMWGINNKQVGTDFCSGLIPLLITDKRFSGQIHDTGRMTDSTT